MYSNCRLFQYYIIDIHTSSKMSVLKICVTCSLYIMSITMNYQTYEYLLSESTNHQDKITPPPPPPLDKMTVILADDNSKCIFEWKWRNSDSNFTEICSHESNWQKASIGSGNRLAPKRRHAITWTNDGLVHWRIYVALGRWVVFRFYDLASQTT